MAYNIEHIRKQTEVISMQKLKLLCMCVLSVLIVTTLSSTAYSYLFSMIN